MKSGGRVLVLLGLVMALIAGAGVYILLGTADQGTAPVPTTKLVMASQRIEPRSEVLAEQLVEADGPQTIPTPMGAFAAPTEVTGKLALVPIDPGLPVTDKMVISKGDLKETHSNASLLIEKGSVAIAMGVSTTSNVANAIQTGDRVDILATLTGQPVSMSGQNTGPAVTASQRLLTDILLLQVGPWASCGGKGDCSSSIVTFQLKEQDALVLKYALDQGGNLTLVLRAANDHQIDTLEPVTLEYINKRFGFKFPTAGQ